MPNLYTYTPEQLAAAKAKLIAKMASDDKKALTEFYKSDRYRLSGAPSL